MAGKGGRTPGAGRKKGVPNKITADIRALAHNYGPDAIRRLAHLMQHAESEQAQVSAARELLDRAYGRPAQAIHHSGSNARDVRELSDEELTAIASTLAGGSGGRAAATPTGSTEPDSLH